jgi:hypothetical protein
MRNQTKHLFVYLWALCLFITSVIQFAQAKQEVSSESSDVTQLSQAQIDQILAPIALYPDTLLSHILVASTYPLEVIQAARWRAVNEDLNEQQALNAVEDKNWDPSVQALVPFNDLLQKLSEDLNWLQSLGSAFLVNEQQILTSVQNLRQRAYEQGNLADNDYVDVEQKEGVIIIETVRKEIVYVPYYDTRVIYGNWWWQNHQPYYWNRPNYSVFNAGSYWSIGFDIRPSFYFGGFHWRNRHVVANYHYRNHADRYWSNGYNRHQVVQVKEYPRWSHNQQHRRGAQHRVNGQRIIRSIDGGSKTKGYRQIDKQRILNVDNYSRKYAKKYNKNKAIRVKQVLNEQQQTALQTKILKIDRSVSNKQRVIAQSKNQQRRALNNELRPQNTVKFESKQHPNRQLQKYSSLKSRVDKETRYPVNTQNNTGAYRSHDKSSSSSSSNNKNINRSNSQNNNYRVSSNKQNRSKPANVSRQNSTTRNQSKIQQR